MNKLLISLAIFLSISYFTSAQSNSKEIKKIIETGQSDNQTMDHIDILANRIGGRLIGSNALVDAENWAIHEFKKWGIEVITEDVGEIQVGFNRGPWFGRMLDDEDGMTLHFATPAYTAGTKGVQVGHVVMEPTSQDEFNRMKGVLKGAWVLINGESQGWPTDCTAEGDAKRAKIISQNDSISKINNERRFYNWEHPDSPKELIPMIEEPALFYRQMVEAGVLGFIQSSPVPLRLLYDRKNAFNITWETLPTVPEIKLDEHQFAIIKQKVLERRTFFLEFDIRNHFSIGPVRYRNVIGVIRGSKYPDEYVMLGGHLDGYDIGTGAVDDANGAAVTMEAARLIALSGAKPKRTILFCLWTGEEYGLYGSKFFVENNKEKLAHISNYFNRDGGPTVANSITVPQAMYDDFVKVCAPILNVNPDFPFTVNKRTSEARPRPKTAGGSDHAYFAMEGVPTISFGSSDPKGYNFNYGEIWHTERDMYGKDIPEYLEHSALVNAVVALGLADLDHILSREGLYKEE